ncbi:MAG TPA: YdeI/OmpD-associated family protein, partial [Chitinophagaceae bacterium]|nr:YdeI/OmpD-associated family protein [Chitinophagaceae bacterium]
FTTTIKKFAEQGEKTGWTYLDIPQTVAAQLKTGTKKSFRVKGFLDQYAISRVALLPMGGGAFILALNSTFRKGLKKGVGAEVDLQLEEDERTRELPAGFLESLADEPAALEQYHRLSKTHKSYFTIWITALKSESGQARRMAQAINALANGQDFVQMVRALKANRNAF